MSDIEQAIKYWEKFKQESVEMIAKGKDRNDILAKQVPMCDIALVALREAEKRSKGCDLCMPVNTMKSMGAYGRKFMYCPMCGKRLEE